MKFNSSGVRQWGTYYGGSANESLPAVACDDTGNVFLAGATSSTNGIASIGAYKTTLSGTTDAYVAKFNSAGVRQWATYIGGTEYDEFTDIRNGNSGNIYVAGTSASVGIATPGAYQTAMVDFSDAYFGEMTGTGQPLWFSYLGGNDREGNVNIAYNNRFLYVAGMTYSTVGLATKGVFQSAKTGYGNMRNHFLAGIALDTLARIHQPFDSVWCSLTDTIRVAYSVSYPFRAGNRFTVQLSDANGSFTLPDTIGYINSTQSDTIKCKLPSGITLGAGYRVRIVSTMPVQTAYDNGTNIKIGTNPVGVSATSNSPVCVGDTIKFNGTSTTTGTSYKWAGPNNFSSTSQAPRINQAINASAGNYILSVYNNGCTVKDTVAVVINPRPAKPVITTNDPVCELDTLKLFSGSATVGASYSWSGPSGFTASQKDTFIALVPLAAAGTYYAIAELNGCRDTGSKAITIKPKPSLPAIVADSTVCEADTLMLGGTSTTPGVSYVWHGPGGFSSSIQQPLIPSAELLNTGMFSLVTVGANGCISDSVHKTITVRPLPDTVYAVTDTLICTGRKMNLRSGPAAPGVSFSWTGPGGFTSQQQDTAIQSANPLTHGDYIVTATLNGCSVSDTVFAYIKMTAPTPIPLPNTLVCIGDSILFRAVIQPAIGVDYNWYGPNGFVATSPLPVKVVATLAGTGWYYVFTTQNNSCASDTVAMHVSVLTHSTPAVTIAATPATATGPYTKITYTATPVNEGTNPLYIWMKNGIRIPRANGNTLEMVTAVDLATGDVVSVAMVSSMLCVWPDTVLSNTWSVFVDLNVKEKAGIGVNVFPNPTNGILNIANGSGLQYTITDIAGRQITSGKVDSAERLDIKDLYPGNYILKLSDGHMSTHIRITKQ